MTTKEQTYELIIVGGGPAGLKAGEEARAAGIDYIILEKGGIADAWQSLRPEMFMLSPCHPQRDWTSLSGKFPIWRLDIRRPFCTAEEFVHYLREYASSYNANLQVRTEVQSITKDTNLFRLGTRSGTYSAPYVLVTTGFLSNPYIPDVPGFRDSDCVIHSHYFKGAKAFRSRRVVVIGAGNSAAETALALCGEAQTHLYTRGNLKFFSKSKNLCHIRGISESLLLEMIKMKLVHHVPNIRALRLENRTLTMKTHSIKIDDIICATGYRPHLQMLNPLSVRYGNTRYYPEISQMGESIQIENLFFGGPLARFRSSSQFIHGFIKVIPQTIHEINRRLRNLY